MFERKKGWYQSTSWRWPWWRWVLWCCADDDDTVSSWRESASTTDTQKNGRRGVAEKKRSREARSHKCISPFRKMWQKSRAWAVMAEARSEMVSPKAKRNDATFAIRPKKWKERRDVRVVSSHVVLYREDWTLEGFKSRAKDWYVAQVRPMGTWQALVSIFVCSSVDKSISGWNLRGDVGYSEPQTWVAKVLKAFTFRIMVSSKARQKQQRTRRVHTTR